MLAETAATWHAAWRRLEHNPLLLLILVAGACGVVEGAARLLSLFQGYLFDADFSYLLLSVAHHGLSLGVTLMVYLSATAAALLVVLHEESFFGAARKLAPRRFWWRAVLAWLIILIVPSLISIPLDLIVSFVRYSAQSADRWVAWSLASNICLALLQALLAALLLWRVPIYGVVMESELPSDHARPPGLFVTYAILFVAVTLIGFAVWQMGGLDFDPLAMLRVRAAMEAVTSLLAVLLAFVAVQRAMAIDRPAVTSVFE